MLAIPYDIIPSTILVPSCNVAERISSAGINIRRMMIIKTVAKNGREMVEKKSPKLRLMTANAVIKV